MNCEDCNNEAEVHYCLECDVLRNNRIVRTPVELAAEEMFKIFNQILQDYSQFMINHDGKLFDERIAANIADIETIIEKLKTPTHQSLPKNPTGSDECKLSQ